DCSVDPPTDPCKVDAQSQGCRAIKEKAWESDQKQARDQHLFPQLLLAASLILGGELAILIGDYLIFKSATIISDQTKALVDALMSLVANVGGFARTILPSDSPLRTIVDGVLAAANIALGI